MATTFYITAGLTAIDTEDAPPATNAFYITAGLVADDRPEEEPPAGTIAAYTMYFTKLRRL